MDYQAISFALENDIATVTLNRPDRMNALNVQMRAELTHALGEAATAARVVVITGAGEAFCSGQDLGEGRAIDLDLERVLREEYLPMLRAIVECPVPVIAAVNGAAAGAGANLALVCDVVIASEDAFFQQAFTRIGLIPDAGGTWALPRQIGLAKAMGAALFAERIPARQAEEWGLIWEVVPMRGFADHVARRALHLAQGPTEAYKRVKEALHASFGNSLDEQLTLEAQLQGACGKTRDFQEGVIAFLEKRPAKYEGR
ncbi:MAG: 2-(1,2-epoxy-1,2-dihydrophenyl)acetyl-CoA isomerase [Rhodobacteraceae bacterium HLUCCA08]|nr:MAG: 2-(1,2-epoxy-1,2-dihydrophenyl)acetyl-CoA isomerase [Rhodobacteraceae bacterium HLUCCA08]